jgi:acyl-CoA thioester hydrolase
VAELIETYRGTVYPWHCDHVGHMNVMWYVGKFDEATWQLFAHLGVTRDVLVSTRRGMAAVEQRIAYKQEVHAGDILTVRSGIIDVRDKVLRFVHEMTHSVTGATCAVMLQTTVQIDSDKRKSVLLPDEVKARARALTVDFELPFK